MTESEDTVAVGLQRHPQASPMLRELRDTYPNRLKSSFLPP